LRRDIFAFAARTPSALVDFCFGFGFPTVGMDRTGVDTIEVCSVGCVLIGPMVSLSWGMMDNSLRLHSFKNATADARRDPRPENAWVTHGKLRIIAELIGLPLIDYAAVWLVPSSADGLHGLDAWS
jgi:hypothetical protein